MSFKRLALLAFVLMSVAVIAADEPVVTAEATPAIQFEVIKQKRIQAGDRTIILNRVAPPILPTIVTPVEVPPAEAELQLEPKQFEFVLLSATVYDRNITELRWFEDGKTYHAFSNIDFNFIAGIGQFETGDTLYSLMLGFGNESSEILAEANREAAARGWPQITLPDLEKFPKGYSSYLVMADSATADSKTFAALDALHAYFDANREKLENAYLEREATRIEQERLRALNPPVPKDTIINYWPKKNSVYLREGSAIKK